MTSIQLNAEGIQALKKVLAYLEDEARDYVERPSDSHIYRSVQILEGAIKHAG